MPFISVIGGQLLNSQSADSFLNMEMETHAPSAPRSHSWLSTLGSSSQREMDVASSHGTHMQEAFLSPLLKKGV